MFANNETNNFFDKKNLGVKSLAESKLILIFYAKEKIDSYICGYYFIIYGVYVYKIF